MGNISQKGGESIDAAQVKQALAVRMLDVCFHLFPNGRKSGAEFHIGNIGSEPGQSLKIVIQGAKTGTWCDFAEGANGGPLDLWMQARNLPFRDALREAAQWLGGGFQSEPAHSQAPTVIRPTPTGPKLPNDARPGTETDWRALAALRHVSKEAVCGAAHLGTLLFGTVGGFPCWILTDARRLICEARRMDGKLFPAIGSLNERKAHTLKDSVKNWPVGLVVSAHAPRPDAPFLVTEGGPDYLAALGFAMRGKPDVLQWHPISFFGAGTGSAIHREALPLLRGRRARFYPHKEASGAGGKAVNKWAEQFIAAGAEVDAFSFAGLRKADGSPVKDLNDCLLIHAGDAWELEGLLP